MHTKCMFVLEAVAAKSKALTIMKQYRACLFFLSKVREAKRGVLKKNKKQSA